MLRLKYHYNGHRPHGPHRNFTITKSKGLLNTPPQHVRSTLLQATKHSNCLGYNMPDLVPANGYEISREVDPGKQSSKRM
ncbi:hypothetical protein PMIN03_003338 [Paraphaeosphaeria minitans]